MTTAKKLGIWMDHANAHTIEYTNGSLETVTIDSDFTHGEKEKSLIRSEHTMHNKEQHQQKEFYDKLGTMIRNYDEVLLFGPTSAKTELLNILREDHNFEQIKIDVESAEKMNDHQMHSFVAHHFSKQ